MEQGAGDLFKMEKVIINQTYISDVTPTSITIPAPIEVIKYLNQLDPDLEVTVTISQYRKNRSLVQNAKLWALVHEIDRVENGRNTDEGEMSVYMNLIEMANIKTEMLMMSLEALDELAKRKLFRHIKVLEQRDSMVVCKCYYGSSTFNTKEMSDFIEATLDYATQLEINLDNYEELRK